MSRDEDAARSAAAARKGANTELTKRFYATASVGETVDGYAVLLDGKTVRTPSKKPLAVPRRATAQALAAEWDAQVKIINPATMPLTRLVNSAIDGVVGQEREVAADAAKFAGSDLLCYRADLPEGLVALQKQHWDPVLAWAARDLGCQFNVTVGVGHVAQPQGSLAKIEGLAAGYDAFALSGLHSMTTLMGSVLLALAAARGHLTGEAAWAAAHVDEDWQVSLWGTDDEALARRQNRWRDMQAAMRLVGTVLSPSVS